MDWTAFRNVMDQGIDNIQYVDIFVRKGELAILDTASVILAGTNEQQLPGVVGVSISSVLLVVGFVTGALALQTVAIIGLVVFGLIEWKHRTNNTKRNLNSAQIEEFLKDNHIITSKADSVRFSSKLTRTTITTEYGKVRLKKKIAAAIEQKLLYG